MFNDMFIRFYKKIHNLFSLLNRFESLFGYSRVKLFFYVCEFSVNISFWINHKLKIASAKKKVSQKELLGGWIDKNSGLLIYGLIRLLKPRTVLETGVGPGFSSSVILKALAKNKQGFLYSIDYPGYDKIYYPKVGKSYNIHVPKGMVTGWLVNEKDRKKWRLIIGDSRELLPFIVQKLKNIDVFLHDSLHTDDNIKFEFKNVLKFSHQNSLFLCDDVNDYWSTAFNDLFNKKDFNSLVLKNRLGIAKFK